MTHLAHNKVLTLEELRALIQSRPPSGSELAEACGYDVHAFAHMIGHSLRRLQQVCRECGTTPHRWLHQRKLLHFLHLLEQLDGRDRLDSLKRVGYW